MEGALEVVMRSLSAEDVRRWPTAEAIYAQNGSPTRKQPEALAVVMKEILKRCYIPIVYKRYKQWERKEWPEKEVAVIPPRPRSQADKVAEAKATMSPEVFQQYLLLQAQAAQISGKPTVQPQKRIVEFKRRAHG